MDVILGVSNITNRNDPNSLKSRLFVGNLNTVHVKKVELEGIFAKYGHIIGISVHKGYAFVQYSSEAEARTAMRFENGNVYYDMKLDISIVYESKNRKRGRSFANNPPSTQSNSVDFSFPNQAFAAIGGQFSQLGFPGAYPEAPVNRVIPPPAPGIIGDPTVAPFPRMPGDLRPRQRFFKPQPPPTNSASMAKRTRLDFPQRPNLPNRHQSASKNLTEIRRNSNSPRPTTTTPLTETSSTPKKRAASSTPKDSPAAPPSVEKPLEVKENEQLDLQSVTSSEDDERERSPSPLRTQSNETEKSDGSSDDKKEEGDILICGGCRRLFSGVEGLVKHKSAGNCRSKPKGEPESLKCATCKALFSSAWELLCHCQSEHQMLIFITTATTTTNSQTPPPISAVTSPVQKNPKPPHTKGLLRRSPRFKNVKVEEVDVERSGEEPGSVGCSAEA